MALISQGIILYGPAVRYAYRQIGLYRFSTVVFQSDLDAHLFPFAVPVEQFVVGFRVAYGSSVRIGEPHDCLSGSIGYVGSYAA